jgi:hypothetical protein
MARAVAKTHFAQWAVRVAGFGRRRSGIISDHQKNSSMSKLRQFLSTAVRSAAFVAVGLLVFSAASAQIVIDDFETSQIITDAGPTVASAADGILGEYRTGRVNWATGETGMAIDGGGAFFAHDLEGNGSVILEWDGDDDTDTYSETGLGGVDLTMDDASVAQLGIRFEVSVEGTYSVLLVVSTDETHASSVAISGAGSSVITIPWLDFGDSGPSGGADFSNVGSIMMVFAGDNDFALGLVDTYPDDDILPVELVSFDAVTNGSTVNLSWNVASESDNSGFYVEHKSVYLAKDWSEMGFVGSKGNTTAGAAYGFTADVALAGRHQFRLRQVDLDGTFTYSPIVEVSVDVPGSFLLGKAYPNPFNPTTSFSLSLAAGQNVEISVFDQLGRQVMTLHKGFLEGSQGHVFNIDASALTTGMYVVRAAGEVATSSMTVTLIK